MSGRDLENSLGRVLDRVEIHQFGSDFYSPHNMDLVILILVNYYKTQNQIQTQELRK